MVFQRRHRSTRTGTLAMAVVLAASVVAVTVAVLGDPDADPSTTSPSAPAQAIPVGTSFTSTSVTGVPIPGSGPLTIAFPEPGRISATAGCNRHMGSAVLQSSATGNILVIGTLASTMMACLPPHDGADAWLRRLTERPLTWHREGSSVTLSNPETTVVLTEDRR